MITYLNGKIIEIGDNTLVIETYGIGYEVYCASSQFYDRMHHNDEIKIYIYEHIKEDAHDLYGFKTKEERELFKKLTSVSGIGPKGGMQILNTYPVEEIIHIILSEDSKALSRVSGIGPKTAQRIILELKDNIPKLQSQINTTFQEKLNTPYTHKQDAIEALISLGYSQVEALQAINTVFDEKDDSEKLIKKALGLLGR